MRKVLLSTTVGLAFAALTMVNMANAQGVPLPPPPGDGGGAVGHGNGSSGGGHHGGGSAGPAVVACGIAAAGNTILGAIRQGSDAEDPRDMTGNEAAWKMTACPVFLPIAAAYSPDNDGTRQVARLTNMWRKTPQGQELTRFCMRGQLADGCSNGMEVFWREEEDAYQNGYANDNMAQNFQMRGILVTRKMVERSKHPLGQKKHKIARHRR